MELAGTALLGSPAPDVAGSSVEAVAWVYLCLLLGVHTRPDNTQPPALPAAAAAAATSVFVHSPARAAVAIVPAAFSSRLKTSA